MLSRCPILDMTTVVNTIKKLGYVEKIFWNTGAYGTGSLPSFGVFFFRNSGLTGN